MGKEPMTTSGTGPTKDPKPFRVFILGAGASKSCGLPLTNELFREVLPTIKDAETRRTLLDFVEYQYPYFKKAWKNYPRFEEFLSLVEVYVQFADVLKKKHKFSKRQVQGLRTRILEAICAFLSNKAEALKSRKTKMTEMAAHLGPHDVVVTFNWDFLLEQALHQAGHKWGYRLRDERISVLKLHGSVDWFDNAEIKIKKKLVFPLDHKVKRIQVFQYFRFPHIKRAIVPVIIPPIFGKQIAYKELRDIWRDAWKAIRRASEIHIVGYSLPPEDLHARFALRSAIRANEKLNSGAVKISVVNPDREVYLRFSRLVRSHVDYFEACFDDVDLNTLFGQRTLHS